MREGVSKDRIVSISDPEMLYGHKSSQQRIDGHKAALAVEAESQLITGAPVLPDNQRALALVESEQNTGGRVCETVANATYGDSETRRQFPETERTLTAKCPTRQDFHIDLEAGRCTCPIREVTPHLHSQGRDHKAHRKWNPWLTTIFRWRSL